MPLSFVRNLLDYMHSSKGAEPGLDSEFVYNRLVQ
jgi:hypothetical protein